MDQYQDIINNLGSLASILSIPLTIILYLIDNAGRIRRARKECAKVLCTKITQGEYLTFFLIKRIIDEVTINHRMISSKSIPHYDILSESLSMISESPLIPEETKLDYRNRIYGYWMKRDDFIRQRESRLRKLLLFSLISVTIFIVVDYFTGGWALEVARRVNLSIILKIVVGIFITIFAIILAVFILELIYRDTYLDKIGLSSTSLKRLSALKPRFLLHKKGTEEGFTLHKVTDNKFYYKRVADSGSQVVSPYGYRLIYEFEAHEVLYSSPSKGIELKYVVRKNSSINGSVVYDLLEIYLLYNGVRKVRSSTILEFYTEGTYEVSEEDKNRLQSYKDHEYLKNYQSSDKEMPLVIKSERDNFVLVTEADTLNLIELSFDQDLWSVYEI